MNYWERRDKLFKYTDGVRQFFPLANEQLDTISRVLEKFNPSIDNFLDLGCGDGFLGHFMYKLYPNSSGVFLDCSKEMIEKARIKDLDHRSEFIVKDFSEADWMKSINSVKKFDLIISGYSIHHIENEAKKRLYASIYNLLNPNGVFLNLEHVSSSTTHLEEIFGDLFDDCMTNYQRHIGDEKSKKEIIEMYHDPTHKKLNKLESVEAQCAWLKELGFEHVDCYMKVFELALFGGVK